MDNYKKFIIYYILGLSSILTPVAFICDLVIFHGDTMTHRILSSLNKNKVDVLYFGDSVIKAHSECEIRIDSMDDLLRKETGLNVLAIDGNNYSPIIYKNYVKLLNKTQYAPKAVVIPINLRSFSDQWFKNPAAQMKMKQFYIDWMAGEGFHLKKYFEYRYLNKESQEMKKWEDMDVIYEDMNLGKIADIGKQVKILDNLDCIRESYDYSKELSILFKLHYMNTISRDHAMFSYLRETLEELSRRDVKIVVYITPINFEDGKKYVGPIFEQRLNNNLSEIKRFLDSSNVDYLDMSMSIGASYFVDKKLSCEHLNFDGKLFVVKTVKKKLVELLTKK